MRRRGPAEALVVLALLTAAQATGGAPPKAPRPPTAPPSTSVQGGLEFATHHLSHSGQNLHDDELRQELRRLLNITQQLLSGHPGAPRHTPELHVPGVSAFLSKLLADYSTLTEDRVVSWAQLVIKFLDAHSRDLPVALFTDSYVTGGQGAGEDEDGVFGLSAVEAARLSGLPLVRRVVLAQLLHAWLGHWGRMAPRATEEAVGDVVKRLYDVHVASVVRRGVIEYLHISKSGGTSFTGAAALNNCAMRRRSEGKIDVLDDRCRWFNETAMQLRTGKESSGWARYGVLRDTVALACHERAAVSASTGYTYVSNEYTLHGGRQDMYDTHTCPQFVGVVTLRDPLDRIKSHLRFVMLRWGGARHLNKTIEAGGTKAVGQLLCSNWQGAEYPPGLWEELLPAVVDNYMTRTFLGESGFHLPVGSVTRQHAALARALLLQFDLVLDLNAGQELGDRLLQHGLGWGTTLAEVAVRTSEGVARGGNIPTDYCLPAGLESLLASGRQAPDQELYRFGLVLNRLDFLFLDVARLLGLRPHVTAGITALDTADSAKFGSVGTQQHCGLLGARQAPTTW